MTTITNSKVRLYTAQSRELITKLRKEGVIYPDKSLESDIGPKAYDWIRKKLVERGIISDLSKSMFWAFDSFDEVSSYDGDIIVLNVDVSKVLVTEYMTWHCALNDSPVITTGVSQDNNFFEEIWNRKYDEAMKLSPEEQLKTWDKLISEPSPNGFLLHPELAVDYGDKYEPVWQYCFEKIEMTDVVDIHEQRAERPTKNEH